MIEENLNREEHLFVLYESIASDVLKKEKNVIVFNPKSTTSAYYYALIFWWLLISKKTFLHGLFDPKLLLLLTITPFWEKKVYWIAWGADLYDKFYDNGKWKTGIIRKLRARIIKRVRHIVTYLQGDYDRAIHWFDSKAEYHECLIYPSNLYKEAKQQRENNESLNIMIGNSADPLNGHLDVFEKIAKNLPKEYKIFSPLSYGNQEYKKNVIAKGEELFGGNFIPIEKLMDATEYTEFLNTMDAVIFNHPIQQAMGNTITALGLGKKVFLNKGTSQWDLFKSLDVNLYQIDDFKNFATDKSFHLTDEHNKLKIKNYFSESNLLRQINSIF